MSISIQIYTFSGSDVCHAIGFGRYNGPQKDGGNKEQDKDHDEVCQLARGHIFDDGSARTRHIACKEIAITNATCVASEGVLLYTLRFQSGREGV